MQIQINVDDLRKMALLSNEAAEKMVQSNNVVSTVVSNHDWKCPERASIDESLELIKKNSLVLDNFCKEFSANVTKWANNYSDSINSQIREDAECEDDIASIISQLTFGGVTSTVSGGKYIRGVTAALKTNSMNESNIVSLCGVSHGINIMDFSTVSIETK